MKKEIRLEDLRPFDASRYLDSEEAIVIFLNEALRDKHVGLLTAALDAVARAKGMTEIAKAAGMSRKALYKLLQEKGSSQFDSLVAVCEALGARVPVESASAGERVRKPRVVKRPRTNDVADGMAAPERLGSRRVA